MKNLDTKSLLSPFAVTITPPGSRFIWSHEFAYVPLGDLVDALETGEVNGAHLKSHNGKPFAEVMALHYLCRPDELENLTPKGVL